MERLIFIIAFFIVACSPQKKLSKLIKKHPELVQSKDTTIYFHTSKTDTNFVFNTQSSRDTFVVENTNTKIYRHYDTLRIYTPPRVDSVVITKNIIQVLPKTKANFKTTIFEGIRVIFFALFIVLIPLISLKIQWKK